MSGKVKPKCAQCGNPLPRRQVMNLTRPEVFCSGQCADVFAREVAEDFKGADE